MENSFFLLAGQLSKKSAYPTHSQVTRAVVRQKILRRDPFFLRFAATLRAVTITPQTAVASAVFQKKALLSGTPCPKNSVGGKKPRRKWHFRRGPRTADGFFPINKSIYFSKYI